MADLPQREEVIFDLAEISHWMESFEGEWDTFGWEPPGSGEDRYQRFQTALNDAMTYIASDGVPTQGDTS